jgi:hypothetical protein
LLAEFLLDRGTVSDLSLEKYSNKHPSELLSYLKGHSFIEAKPLFIFTLKEAPRNIYVVEGWKEGRPNGIEVTFAIKLVNSNFLVSLG